MALLLVVASLVACLGASGSAASPSPSPSPDPSAGASPAVPDPSAIPSTPAASLQPLPSMAPVLPLDPAGPRPGLSKEVVAYLPYWIATSLDVPYDPATDPYIVGSRLTDIVLFSVGVRRNGSLKLDTPGAAFVMGPRAAAIITAAHARGIRVLVSFTSGGYQNNAKLFGSQPAMDRFVAEATALVHARGLDGADMDVELIDGDYFDAYAATAGRLKTSLTSLDPAARVMVATNGNRSGARMARRAIRAGVDRAFLMGYAYRGPTSSPVGSISPLDRQDGRLDLRDSLQLYRDREVPLEQVIIGLPAYGLTYATLGPELHAERAPARVSARGRITFFRDVEAVSPPDAVLDEDLAEGAARVSWYDPARGSWFQTYYDTPATLRAKYVLALEADTAGVGIWTLGYDAGLPGYPELVGHVFSQPVVGSVTADPAVTDALVVRVAATTYDGPAATSGVRLSEDGLAWSAWMDAGLLDPAREGPLDWTLAAGPDGDRQVWVQSGDIAGGLSMPVMTTLLLDRTPPLIMDLALRPAPMSGWIAQFVATDQGGIATTEIRWRVGDADWTAWQPLDSLAAGSTLAAPTDDVRAELRVTDRAGHVTLASTRASGWSHP